MNTNSIKPRAFKGLITTAAIATLVACGGGGGGGSSDEDAAIGSTEVLTQGAIQRFGSVYVN
ncbi:MAG: hypothetical protein JSU67_08460, partial [Gammaproteobacteria bacterium]